MIMAILLAAYFLNFVITSIGLTGQVNRFITEPRPHAGRSSSSPW